jgi:protein-disulfide isomerase
MRNILMAGLCLLLAISASGTGWAQDKMPSLGPGDEVLGKPVAPVTIVEYASMTCPHCAAFAAETYPKIRAEWIDTGKAKYVFRDFPLDRYALIAAQIAHCAPKDRYFAFVEAIFDSQANWARAPDPVVALKGIARLGGMTAEAVDKCVADEAMQKQVIDTEMQAKNDYGVNSTPTFFILSAGGNTKLVGETPYDEFNKALIAASPKS